MIRPAFEAAFFFDVPLWATAALSVLPEAFMKGRRSRLIPGILGHSPASS